MSPVDVSDGSGAGNTAVNDDCEGDICEIHDFSHFRKKGSQFKPSEPTSWKFRKQAGMDAMEEE